MSKLCNFFVLIHATISVFPMMLTEVLLILVLVCLKCFIALGTGVNVIKLFPQSLMKRPNKLV